METSIFLARVIGVVSVFTTAAIMVRYKELTALEEEAVKGPLHIFLSGFISVILGTLLVVSHSVWVFDWRVVITIIGWIVLLKGVLRIFFPKLVKRLIEKKKNNHKFILGELVVFLVGIYLLYYGFIVY